MLEAKEKLCMCRGIYSEGGFGVCVGGGVWGQRSSGPKVCSHCRGESILLGNATKDIYVCVSVC